MKLQTDNLRLGDGLASLTKALHQLLPAMARQVNAVSEGRIEGRHNAHTSPPAIGPYAQGDYVPNKKPVVSGPAGGQYVIKGWVCVAGGTPGTWVEDRGLTGT